jgi:hypothetical protein
MKLGDILIFSLNPYVRQFAVLRFLFSKDKIKQKTEVSCDRRGID